MNGTRFFKLLLRLYPPEFREEFGAEMTAVFAEAIRKAAKQSWLSLAAVCLREIRDWPVSVLEAHWRSKMTVKEINLMTLMKKPEWFFVPGWVVLTTLSIPLAFAITWLIISQVEPLVGGRVMINGRSHITEDWLAGYLFFPSLGLVTGFMQFLLMRRYLPRMGWWVGTTALGWPLATLLVFYLGRFLPEGLDMNDKGVVLLMIFIVGALVSVMQWQVLRRRVPHAIWWIPATIAGWMAVRLAAGETLTGPLDIWYLGMLPALITGVALWFLLSPLTPLPEV